MGGYRSNVLMHTQTDEISRRDMRRIRQTPSSSNRVNCAQVLGHAIGDYEGKGSAESETKSRFRQDDIDVAFYTVEGVACAAAYPSVY